MPVMLPRKKLSAALLAGAVAVALAAWFLAPGGSAPAQPKDGKVADKADEMFGYTRAFEQELKKLGQISPAQFAQMYPSKAQYAKGLSWDPTTAKFFSDFQADPKNSQKPWLFDFRLNEQE